MKTTNSLSVLFRLLKLFVLVLTVVPIILFSFTLSSVATEQKPSLDTYLVQLDYENVNFAAVFQNDTYDYDPHTNDTKLPRYRRVGYFGYVTERVSDGFVNYGMFPLNGVYDERLPGLSDFYKGLQNENSLIYGASQNGEYSDVYPYWRVHLPDGLEGRKSWLKQRFLGGFITLAIALGFTAIAFLFNLAALLTPAKYLLFGISGWLHYLSFVVGLASGAISTRLITTVISKFDDAYDEFGIKASFGNAWFFIFLWVAIGIEGVIALGFFLQDLIVDALIKSIYPNGKDIVANKRQPHKFPVLFTPEYQNYQHQDTDQGGFTTSKDSRGDSLDTTP